MDRRSILKALAAIPFAESALAASSPRNMADIKTLQSNWRNFLPAGAQVPSAAEPLKLDNAEWKKRLSPESFNVLRKEGTERAGTSPLNNEKRAGIFACAGCGLPLFTSEMKFESGTGWPSFFTTIPGAFEHKKDFLLIYPRTEYHCARCGGHHGHVFDDGPPPTHQRWCNNGVALKFIPKDGPA
ncbi:MAG TPA: peptide-methionine (R)-S-oxide reductase MsrB [Burkholderiales bacterium]|jgi:peptide-methionine (R)-S-oxide reductase|nr:peptide-methionine (R)-S-oxide reductase MsrB [Burkholderiales bacterium]